jgi:hypothetical protein
MPGLCTTLNSEPVLGQRTRRMHIGQRAHFAFVNEGPTCHSDTFSLTVRHCPNLEILIIEGIIHNSFSSIVTSLFTHCSKSLRTVHWVVPFRQLPQVIWALHSLSSLTYVHIGFSSYQSSWADHPGVANDIILELHNLRQLSLEDVAQEFMERACRWNMPSLESFSLDLRNNHTELHPVPHTPRFKTNVPQHFLNPRTGRS